MNIYKLEIAIKALLDYIEDYLPIEKMFFSDEQSLRFQKAKNALQILESMREFQYFRIKSPKLGCFDISGDFSIRIGQSYRENQSVFVIRKHTVENENSPEERIFREKMDYINCPHASVVTDIYIEDDCLVLTMKRT